MANKNPVPLSRPNVQLFKNNDNTSTAPIQKKENTTGLPDNLKSGIENLSGHSMDDVKVHYNSDKPAQLQAHAYAQGTDIHLGTGQEKHLPHEAWHVVQQKQGRVKPTTEIGGAKVNDNGGLEKEADVLGAKALQMKEIAISQLEHKKMPSTSSTLQREAIDVDKEMDDNVLSYINGNEKNTAAANETYKLLKSKQKTDDTGRLTNTIIRILVWGVGTNINEQSDLGKEGIIGIHHAKTFADTLIGMKDKHYIGVLQNLIDAGGNELFSKDDAPEQWRVECVLILKAVAARKTEYLNGDDWAVYDVDLFAEDIRGIDKDSLKTMTTVRDHGDGQGLRQKYTNSCAPSALQIVLGEADPIYAKKINENGKFDLNTDSSVGKEQKVLLNHNQVKPRLIEEKRTAYDSIIPTITKTFSETKGVLALDSYIKRKEYDKEDYKIGLEFVKKHGFSEDDMETFRKFQSFRTRGIGATEIIQAIEDINLENRTGSAYTLKKFNKPVTTNNLDVIWNELYKGRDLPIGMLWDKGGGHYMSLTQAKGTPPDGGSDRQFLLSDPWYGNSVWLTDSDIKNGDFGKIGKGVLFHISL